MRQRAAAQTHAHAPYGGRPDPPGHRAPPRIVLTHGLRNASVTIVTVVGLQLGQLIGGVVVTKMIFS